MDERPKDKSTSDPDLAIVIQNRLMEELAESERQHSALLNDLPDVVVRLDSGGNILFLNEAWRKRFGFDVDGSLGRDIRDFLHEEDRSKWDEAISQVGESDDADHVIRLMDADAEVHLVDARLRRLESGEIVGSLEDVTVRHNLETERLRTQRLESIGRLAGGLAHDFNNLLTVILGNVSLAQRRLRMQDLELKELDLTARACEQAASLARQMLAFSKGGEPRRDAADLGDLVREGVELYVRGSNVSLELNIEPDLQPVDMDSSQIHQVLNNLIVNAIQSMPDGGRLRVDVESCMFSSTPEDVPERGVSVSVRDEGMGIPSDHLEHIFEPYFTTKESGNGLGLTSAYWIIKRHHGTLEVESASGVGTLFRFVLPLARGEINDSSEHVRSLEKTTGRILVMDDDELVRGAMVAMIESLGHEVTGVADGASCLEAYSKAHEGGTPYDLVVLDLTIVGGHDGLWTIARLKDFDPDVKAVVASGYSNAPVVSDHERFGFVGVLSKPMTLDEIDEVANRFIGDSSSTVSRRLPPR